MGSRVVHASDRVRIDPIRDSQQAPLRIAGDLELDPPSRLRGDERARYTGGRAVEGAEWPGRFACVAHRANSLAGSFDEEPAMIVPAPDPPGVRGPPAPDPPGLP